MALHSFKATVENGKILVTANAENTKKANMSRPPRLLASGTEVILSVNQSLVQD
jgi:hypothetical protein